MDDISKIFREALKKKLADGEWGIKSRVAKESNLTPPQLHDLIIGRRFGSEEQRRAIAAALGYPGRAYENFLDIGRQLLELPALADEPTTPQPTAIVDLLTAGLSPEQAKHLQIYRELLIMGGEGVEALTEAIISLAAKKNARQGNKTGDQTA